MTLPAAHGPRAYITGMAQISSLGDSLDAFWAGLQNGASGLAPTPGWFVPCANFMNTSISLPALDENLFVEENRRVARHLINSLRLRGRRVDGLVWGNGQQGFKYGNLMRGDDKEILTSNVWREILLNILFENDVRMEPSQIIN